MRPELSIPRGELSALASCLVTYMVVVFAFGACVPRETLKDEYLVLSQASYWPWGVTIGVLVSTSSSALASIQSSARILQALALDGIVPPLRRFAVTYRGEPALAVLVSISIAFCVLLIGSLNAIAPVLTMFFLITYAARSPLAPLRLLLVTLVLALL
jgi:amino acid transporter